MIKASALLALALLVSPVSLTEGLKPSSALSKLQNEIHGNDVNVHVTVNVNEDKHPLHWFLNKGPHEGHNHQTPEAELDCFGLGGGGMSGMFSKLMSMFGGGNHSNKNNNNNNNNNNDNETDNNSSPSNTSEDDEPPKVSGSHGYDGELDDAYELNQGEHEGHNHETIEAELDCFGGGHKKKKSAPPPQPEEQSSDNDDNAPNVSSNGPSRYEAEVDEAEDTDA